MAVPVGWQALCDLAAPWVKTDGCDEHGARFGGAHGLGTQSGQFLAQVIVGGEVMRDGTRAPPQRHRRRGADCVIFLLRPDGTVQLLLVELKAGVHRVSLEEIVEKLLHSTEDALTVAEVADIAVQRPVLYSAPRLPPNIERRMAELQERVPPFRLAPAVDKRMDLHASELRITQGGQLRGSGSDGQH